MEDEEILEDLEEETDILDPETGIRALWLLYKRGQWGYLQDFGVERGDAEPVLRAFDEQNLIGNRLTKAQARKLAKIVPEFEGAGEELRLAYLLKELVERRTYG